MFRACRTATEWKKKEDGSRLRLNSTYPLHPEQEEQLDLEPVDSSDDGVSDASDWAPGDSLQSENSLVSAGSSDSPPPDSQLSPGGGQSPSPVVSDVGRVINKKAPKRKASDDDRELQKLTILKEMSAAVLAGLNQPRDSDALFAQQIAAEVRQIRSPILRMRAKKTIMTLVYEFQEQDQREAQVPRHTDGFSEYHASFRIPPAPAPGPAHGRYFHPRPPPAYTEMLHSSEPDVYLKGEKKLRKAGSREYRRITDSEDEREFTTNSGQELVQSTKEKATPSPYQNKLGKAQETGRQTTDDEQEPAVSGYQTMPRIVDGSVRSTFNGKDMIENGLQNKAVENETSGVAKEEKIGGNNRDGDTTDCSESLLLPVHVVSVQDERETAISVQPPASENPATFWRKCREAGCVEQIMNKLTATVTDISERIIADRASDEDYAFAMTVLEASGMLPNVLQEKERELKEQLENLKEIDALRSSQHAINELKQRPSIKQESNSC
ncbi:uncharacterized protein [Lepisosteus oculatus]|uniref:uncharacterized protein isoform X2 n=1 Tax=Lepisosteus oculatus TaxID=7918 RepID=UPI0035F51EB5